MTIQDFQDRLCGYRPTLQQARAEFAVLVPLIERPDGLHLLYEVRAQNLRHHAAEVCFPGGRMEPGETPVQCALRETWEELAIAPEDVTVLGELDFLYLRSECLMHPVLARVDAAALGHMRRSPAEVRDTFLVPIDWLRTHPPEVYRYRLYPVGIESFPYDAAGVPADYRWQCAQMEVPVYRGLPHPLWGLTARITDWLIQRFCAEPTP